MKQSRGFVSLFSLLILAPLIFLSLFIVDYSRIMFAKFQIQNVNDVALTNVLSHFDRNLYHTYGLYGIQSNQSNESFIVSMMVKGVQGSLTNQEAQKLSEQLIKGENVIGLWEKSLDRTTQKRQTNINRIYLPLKPKLQPLLEMTLSQTDVLYNQIINYSKFRGLLNMAQGFLNKMQQFNGLDHVLENEKKRLIFEKENSKYRDKLFQVTQTLRQLDELLEREHNDVFLSQSSEQLHDEIKLAFEKNQLNNRMRKTLALITSIKKNYGTLMTDMKLMYPIFQQSQKQLLEWEKFVKAYDGEDKVSVEGTLHQAKVAFETINLDSAIKQIETAINDINKFENILKSSSINQQKILEIAHNTDDMTTPSDDEAEDKQSETLLQIEIEKFDKFKIDRWMDFDFYPVLMMQFFQKGQKKVVASFKKNVSEITRSAKQQHIPDFKMPTGNETIVDSRDMVITEGNFFENGIKGITNTIQFFSKAKGLNDLFNRSISEVLVMEYLTEMFTNYVDNQQRVPTAVKKSNLLSGKKIQHLSLPFKGAEMEYILFGKSSAKANVEAAINQIKWIRFGLNLMFTYSDYQLRAMIQAASAIAGPFAPIIQHFLHVFLAISETELDIDQLLKGRSVPLLKTTQSWILQPTNLDGLFQIGVDAIKNRIEQGVEHVQSNVYSWFENKMEDVEKGLLDFTDQMVMTQIDTLLSVMDTQFFSPLLDQIIGLANGTKKSIELHSKAYVHKKWEQLESNPMLQSEPMKSLFNQHILNQKETILTIFDENLKKLANFPIEKRTEKFMSEFTMKIREQLKKIESPVRQMVKEHIKPFKDRALAILKQSGNQLSEKVKGELVALTDNWISSREKAPIKSGVSKKSLIGLTYPEYLKLFTLIGLIAHDYRTIYFRRMVQLIDKNLNLDLSNYYAAFSLNTHYTIENLYFSELFSLGTKNLLQVMSVSGY